MIVEVMREWEKIHEHNKILCFVYIYHSPPSIKYYLYFVEQWENGNFFSPVNDLKINKKHYDSAYFYIICLCSLKCESDFLKTL